MKPFTNYIVALGDLRKTMEQNPYNPKFGSVEGYMRYIKYNTPEATLPIEGRKRGRWIYGENKYGIDGYCCNICEFFVPWDYIHKFINYIDDYKFCPHCGAEMRRTDDSD